jgi:hypothetical protein
MIANRYKYHFWSGSFRVQPAYIHANVIASSCSISCVITTTDLSIQTASPSILSGYSLVNIPYHNAPVDTVVPEQRTTRKRHRIPTFYMAITRVLTERLTAARCTIPCWQSYGFLPALSSALISPGLGDRQSRQMIRTLDKNHFSQISSVPLDTRKEEASQW